MGKIVIAIIVFVVSYFIFHDLGVGAAIGTLLALGASIASFVFLVKKGEKNTDQVGEENIDFEGREKLVNDTSIANEFSPDFKYKNMAIDTKSGKLWMKDIRHEVITVDKQDILRWNYVYTTRSKYHLNNRIEIHIRDLNNQKWIVPFDLHIDSFAWGASQNRSDAEQWESRLTTWVNSTD